MKIESITIKSSRCFNEIGENIHLYVEKGTVLFY
jgi:hypothetical protein